MTNDRDVSARDTSAKYGVEINAHDLDRREANTVKPADHVPCDAPLEPPEGAESDD